jgi:hypothetical protein
MTAPPILHQHPSTATELSIFRARLQPKASICIAMGALPRGLLAGICAVLLAAVVAHGAEQETASMVVGLAKCADCTRKNVKAEAAFNGARAAINYPTICNLHFAGQTICNLPVYLLFFCPFRPSSGCQVQERRRRLRDQGPR